MSDSIFTSDEPHCSEVDTVYPECVNGCISEKYIRNSTAKTEALHVLYVRNLGKIWKLYVGCFSLSCHLSHA